MAKAGSLDRHRLPFKVEFPPTHHFEITRQGKGTAMDDQEALRLAKRKVDAKIGFFIHAAIYVTVNAILAAINLTTTPGYLWFAWAVFGWGIGLFFHGLSVYAFGEGSTLKQRMVESELSKQAPGDE